MSEIIEQRVRAGFGLASWVITVTTWAGAITGFVGTGRRARLALRARVIGPLRVGGHYLWHVVTRRATVAVTYYY